MRLFGAPGTAPVTAADGTLSLTRAERCKAWDGVGVSLWPVILGLVLGGMLAAPVAALLARRLPGRRLVAIVGAVVSLLALRSLQAAVPAAALSGQCPGTVSP
jgi:uncharacterized membrane protein YfcA